ncbi:hypothetical protein FQJ88_16450 [Xanthomonas vasicola]|uniref:Secreted protein n=1 Tax=Xanthomonas vasicola TaxID=56459 RepID=A0ABD7S892_XANVA|nr:hypothetical protein NX81_009990 [Xanthomonas vasicola]TWQ27842.1 hypothetical protein FQJ97_09415 [Xanthomonas vasicola]TWQ36348.1 hypothetical protein FQJ96_16195 [Xanthomonas vasicola]TWQ51003.1 hypothetical protein FQK01_16630 [Xanthomonas vasicola]TWQ51204.1 hypothetical protein FQJ94_19265 [Xanthomonas vasicola]
MFVADLPAAVAPSPAPSSAQVATHCVAHVQNAACFLQLHVPQSCSRMVRPSLSGVRRNAFYDAGCSGVSMTLCQ